MWEESSPGESDRYNQFIRHEKTRVAVCDQVESALRDDASCPPQLRKIILDSFLEWYATYEEEAKPLLQEDGTKIKDAVSGIYITAQYSTLLKRLQDLREKVEKKLKEAAAP
ncbi:hypothetical protein MTO96_008814 [Rhipicephalus appendiculatus]